MKYDSFLNLTNLSKKLTCIWVIYSGFILLFGWMNLDNIAPYLLVAGTAMALTLINLFETEKFQLSLNSIMTISIVVVCYSVPSNKYLFVRALNDTLEPTNLPKLVIMFVWFLTPVLIWFLVRLRCLSKISE